MRCFKGSKLHLSPSAFDQKGRSQSSFRQQRLLQQRLSLPDPERLQTTSNGAQQQNTPKQLPAPKTVPRYLWAYSVHIRDEKKCIY